MTFEELLKKWNNGRMDGAKTAFAKKLGFEASSLSHWQSGRSRPSEDARRKIAKEFRMTLEEVDSVFTEPERCAAGFADRSAAYSGSARGKTPVSFVPVLGEVSGETFHFDPAKAATIATLPIPAISADYFALRLRGDAWKPAASDGSYAYIQKTAFAMDGQTVLAAIGGDTCTIQTAIGRVDNAPALTPLSRLDPKPCPGLKIIGVVVGFFSFPPAD